MRAVMYNTRSDHSQKLETNLDIQGRKITVITSVPRVLLEVEAGCDFAQREHDVNIGRAVRIHCKSGQQYQTTVVNQKYQDAVTAQYNTMLIYTVIEDVDDA